MANPDQLLAMLPRNLENISTSEFQSYGLNPFQLNLFLKLHEYYDAYLHINALRSRTYGPQQIDTEDTKQSVRRILAVDEEDNASTPHLLLEKAAELMAFTVSGFKEYEALTELCIRGILDIDKKTYEKMYKYLEKYTLGLRLDDESEKIETNDQRFLSNRQGVRSLQANLTGATLHAIGFPDADKYSDVNFHRFLQGGSERVRQVMKETRT